MPPDPPDTGHAPDLASEPDAFDLWLRRGLQAHYAPIVAEPLPAALLRLAAGADAAIPAAEDRFDQRVRERAYYLWLREGRPEGRALEHWMAAFVQQLVQEAGQAATRPAAARAPGRGRGASRPPKGRA